MAVDIAGLAAWTSVRGDGRLRVVHHYRRFIQDELDARGWEPKELTKRSGLHRQAIWKILHDERPMLGQMPDESTMEAIARGFDIPVERVRTAAARSLRGYKDAGEALRIDLSTVSADELLMELRSRIPVYDSEHRVWRWRSDSGAKWTQNGEQGQGFGHK